MDIHFCLEQPNGFKDVHQHDIDLDELLDGEWMEKARSRARIRLIDSIRIQGGVAVVGGDIFTRRGRIIEAFFFLLCAFSSVRFRRRASNCSLGPGRSNQSGTGFDKRQRKI